MREAILAITRSNLFSRRKRLKDLLNFLVSQVLSPGRNQLSQAVIAREVFAKGLDFDPVTDPLVRVQMSRLRRALDAYYLTEGRGLSPQIVLQPGDYTPQFEFFETVMESSGRPTLHLDVVSGPLRQEFLGLLTRFRLFEISMEPTPGSYRIELEKVGDTINCRVFWGTLCLWATSNKSSQALAPLIAGHYGIAARHLARQNCRKRSEELNAGEAVAQFLHAIESHEATAIVLAHQGLLSALERFPNDSFLYAALVDAAVTSYFLGLDFSSLEEAETWSRRALLLDGQCGQVAWACGLLAFAQKDKARALVELERAAQFNPFCADRLLCAGTYLTLLGEEVAGLGYVARAEELNPEVPSWSHFPRFWAAYRAKNYEMAYTHSLKIRSPELFWDGIARAVCSGRLGQQGRARKAVEELVRLKPNFPTTGRTLIRRLAPTLKEADALESGLELAGLNFDDSRTPASIRSD